MQISNVIKSLFTQNKNTRNINTYYRYSINCISDGDLSIEYQYYCDDIDEYKVIHDFWKSIAGYECNYDIISVDRLYKINHEH